MHIQYYGLSSFRLTTKEAVVILDPFSKDSGLTAPRGSADIILLSEKTNDMTSAISGFSGNPFLITDPGEYDVKGVTVTGIPLPQKDTYVTVFLIEAEDIKILNLAHIADFNMKEDDLEGLGEIDILLLPVGGTHVLDASVAAKVTNQIQPSVVIPSCFEMPGLKLPFTKIDKFIKELGGKAETLEKLIAKKKDLNAETTNLVILEPLR